MLVLVLVMPGLLLRPLPCRSSILDISTALEGINLSLSPILHIDVALEICLRGRSKRDSFVTPPPPPASQVAVLTFSLAAVGLCIFSLASRHVNKLTTDIWEHMVEVRHVIPYLFNRFSRLYQLC